MKIDWKSLEGRTLKIVIAEPDETIIGIDEQDNTYYVLDRSTAVLLHGVALPKAPEPRKIIDGLRWWD